MKNNSKYFTSSRNKFSDIRFTQNFLKSRLVSREIIKKCSLNTSVIIEIGSGDGALTEFLLYQCKKLIAIEKDVILYRKLLFRFVNNSNIEIINMDFLNYKLPLDQDYCIVGNIPFNLTSDILRKILKSYPSKACLIIQKEAYDRLVGRVNESLFSLSFKPWFTVRKLIDLNRKVFKPVPNVNCVLIEIKKRHTPAIAKRLRSEYESFIMKCFTSWKKDVDHSLKFYFTFNQWKRIKKDLDIEGSIKPSELDYEKWVDLFNIFLKLKR